MRKIIKLTTSFFYLGHSPFMPGTLGSLAGLLIYFVVKDKLPIYLFSVLFLFTLGIIFSSEAERIYRRKDAQMIVIDEACGMMLSMFLVPYSLWVMILGFILFRAFDILKPPPARRIENFSGAFGIMFDDVIAAIYTNFILQIVTRIFCNSPVF
ncbi:MAG: phosphatidylglycerophosphatase A [Candidatus Omnitrophota bacterium]|nr:phosphatidylglycerophosphatase A [Candidatus Omnitrophota bacterium]